MTEDAGIWHGGDLDEARRLFPRAPEPWIDLSTGINPVPYPVPALPSACFERLPSPGDRADLERAAAEAYAAADPETILSAPGTQILINLLPRMRRRSRVAILGPTYQEHEVSWRAAGHEVSEVAALEHVGDADVVVAVNPNNPDGRILARQALVEHAARLHRAGGWLVVDEAFADFEAGESLIPVLPRGAVVLRSFGKTYGLAGLRLGFAAGPRGLMSSLRAALGPWAISGPALEVGRQALRDRDWLAAARQARIEDARRLDAILHGLAGAAAKGTTLFRLLETRQAPALFQHLGQHGIWIRRFQHHPDRLRFGLPGGDPGWRRIDAAGRTWTRR